MNSFLKYKLDYLLIILLSFPVLFLKLGSFSLRLWDESIYATNSIEMMERGEWIVPYFNGEMDYWNTKPPLINWLQILSMKIFGINELAIRLPSAFAALFTVLLLYWFLKKHFNQLTGFIGSMVLLTSVGFVTFHGARTGDTDALLTLFVTALCIFSLDMILDDRLSQKKIILVFSVLLLGFLTKSVAAFLFIPPIMLFLFIRNKNLIAEALRSRVFWISLSAFVLMVFGFVLWRNTLQPGYLEAVFADDMGRVAKDYGKHNESFNFYIDNLVNHRYSYWIILYMASLLLLFISDENPKRQMAIRYVAVLSLFYFTFISLSITKLAWYDLPLFPLLAVNVALFMQFVVEKINFSFYRTAVVMIILFVVPYKHVFGLSQTNHYSPFEMENEAKERYLKEFLDHPELVRGEKLIVYHTGYERSLLFYEKLLEQKGIEVEITADIPNPEKNDLLLISTPENIDHHHGNTYTFHNNFYMKKMDHFENAQLFKITTYVIY